MYIKDENFIIIQGWMITKLGLSGNNLLVYSIIYGFSQDGVSTYNAPIKYLVEFTGVSEATCRRALNCLLEKNYIIKVEDEPRYSETVIPKYKVNMPVLSEINSTTNGCIPPLQNDRGGIKMTGGGIKMTPQINNNIINYDKTDKTDKDNNTHAHTCERESESLYDKIHKTKKKLASKGLSWLFYNELTAFVKPYYYTEVLTQEQCDVVNNLYLEQCKEHEKNIVEIALKYTLKRMIYDYKKVNNFNGYLIQAFGKNIKRLETPERPINELLEELKIKLDEEEKCLLYFKEKYKISDYEYFMLFAFDTKDECRKKFKEKNGMSDEEYNDLFEDEG